MLLDEDAGLFMVTSARNWEEANPDVLSFSDVTGCKLDIDEQQDGDRIQGSGWRAAELQSQAVCLFL